MCPGALIRAAQTDSFSSCSSSLGTPITRRWRRLPFCFGGIPRPAHSVPDLRRLTRANALVVPWIAAIVRQRLQDDGARVSDIPERAGWVGNIDNGVVARAGAANETSGSWLPDEESARAWRALRGSGQ